MACRRQSHGTRWKARCTQYWVKSATSTISRSCRTTGWDATASWSQGCVAHRKNRAAGSIVSTTVTCTRRWLIAKCMRSVVQPRRKIGCSRNRGITRSSGTRSEEHTSELQSHVNLVCRLLLEKKQHRSRVYGRVFLRSSTVPHDGEYIAR